jgi:hypothetical protein
LTNFAAKFFLELAFRFITALVIPRQHSNWLGSLMGLGIGVTARIGAVGSINIGDVYDRASQKRLN